MHNVLGEKTWLNWSISKDSENSPSVVFFTWLAICPGGREMIIFTKTLRGARFVAANL